MASKNVTYTGWQQGGVVTNFRYHKTSSSLDLTTDTVGGFGNYPRIAHPAVPIDWANEPWTIECFTNFIDGSVHQTIFGFGDEPSGSSAQVYGGATYLHFYTLQGGSNGAVTFSDNVTQNEWHHCVLSYDPATKTMYLGRNGAMYTAVRTTAWTIPSGADLYLGQRPTGTSDQTALANCYMDNLRVSSRIVYTTNYTVPDPVGEGWTTGGDTRAYFDFDLIPYTDAVKTIDTPGWAPGLASAVNTYPHRGYYSLDLRWASITNYEYPTVTAPLDWATEPWTIEFFMYHLNGVSNAWNNETYVSIGNNHASTGTRVEAALFGGLKQLKFSAYGGQWKTGTITETHTTQTWIHHFMSYDPNTLTMYYGRNGVSNTTLRTVAWPLVGDIKFGYRTNPSYVGSNHRTNGYMDDIRISNAILYTGTTYTVPDPEVDGWAEGGSTVKYYDFENPSDVTIAHTARPFNLHVTTTPSSAAVYYEVNSSGKSEYAGTGDVDITVLPGDSVELTCTDDTYSTSTETVTIPAISTENMGDFKLNNRNPRGKIDFTTMDGSVRSTLLSSDLDDTFTTGENLQLRAGRTTKYVKTGETVSLDQSSQVSLLVPDMEVAEVVNLDLGDGTVTLTSTGAENEFTIGAATLAAGSTVSDGGHIITLEVL